jgi:hypothetical protein
MLSPDQRKLYWANLNQVYAAASGTGTAKLPLGEFRAAFHQQHNLPASTKDFTKAHMDAFLAACAAILKPADLAPQLRALNQPKARQLWKINNWLAPQLKALGVADPLGYIAEIASDKFGMLPADLSDSPRSAHGSRYSQLDNLQFTVTNRVKTLRQQRGWTVHELLWNSGLGKTCQCAQCKKVGTVAPRGPLREPELADNVPF